MSNRLKSSTNRMRCDRCKRRNQRLSLRTFTTQEAENARQTATAMLCEPCQQQVLANLSSNYELVAQHAGNTSYASMDRAEYKKRLRDSNPPPAAS